MDDPGASDGEGSGTTTRRAPGGFRALSGLLSRVMGAATVDTLDAAVETCVEHMGTHAGVDVAFVTLIDEKERVSDDWRWARGYGHDLPTLPVGHPISRTFSSSVELLRLGITVVVDDLDQVDLAPAERSTTRSWDFRAILIAPVRVRQVLLGACGFIVRGRPHHWDRTTISRVELMADLIVQGVIRARDRGALALADARARRIADFIPDGLALLDLDGRIVWTSPSLVRMTGLTAAELLHRPAGELVHPDDRPALVQALSELSGDARRLGLRTRAGDDWRWTEMTWRTVSEPDAQVPDEIVLSLRDQHDGYLQYQALSQLAEQDPLTGAANRVGLDRHLAELEDQGAEVVFVFCDLDGFKEVNDGRGHDAGDEVLAAVARALRTAVRTGDLVARLGGDEFAIVVSDPGDPAALGDRLVEGVRNAAGGAVTASIGIAGPGRAGDVELRRRADAAMYRAKRSGKDRWLHLLPDDPNP